MSDTSSRELTYNLADLWEAVVPLVADRVAVACLDTEITFAQLEDRSNRLANHLAAQGIGAGDHVGIYLLNGYEYLEVMLAAFKLGAVPININYRYVANELRYLFDDADLVALVYHDHFTDHVAEVRDEVPELTTFVSVASTFEPRANMAPESIGAVDYETTIAASDPAQPRTPRSGDDRYVIYTGGTTGMPKGVVWRQEDAFFACIGGGDPMRLSGPVAEPAEVLERVIDFDFVAFPLAPMMHAAAQWTSISWLLCGAKVVLNPGSFDALATWKAIESQKVSTLIVVGDAMVRPLVDAWDEHGPFDTSSLYAVGSGGAPLTVSLKERLMEILPNASVSDGFGSSETGAQGAQRLQPGDSTGGATKFVPMNDSTTVLADDLSVVVPGSGVVGRVALTGRIPLGYYNAPEKTAETFVTVDGARWVLTGDAATVDEDGSVALLGRGSVSINTGGEKVYPEEVEAALKSAEGVYDAVVVGVPDERFGERVCALVQPNPGATISLESLNEQVRHHVAGYKVPRDLVVVDSVVRSPVGKPDYRWARSTALEALGIDEPVTR